MSTRSKAKRDARRKKMKGSARSTRPRPIAEHAHLVVDQKIVGGAGLRGGEWVLVLGGQVVASTESAAMILAMLKHVATLQEQAGHGVELSYSTHLRDAATAEANGEGKTLEAYLDALEAERNEHAGERDEGEAAPGGEGEAVAVADSGADSGTDSCAYADARPSGDSQAQLIPRKRVRE